MEEGVMGVCRSMSDESSMEDSTNSIGSPSSSSDLIEDVSSSSQETMSPHTNGPLYELSELMAQLPIKRGLSKFYQGKSQSHTSLASVKGLEDLAKRGPFPHRSFKMKPCKSHVGLDGHSKSFRPKATISKKASRASFLSSFGRRGPFVGTVGLSFSCTK